MGLLTMYMYIYIYTYTNTHLRVGTEAGIGRYATECQSGAHAHAHTPADANANVNAGAMTGVAKICCVRYAYAIVVCSLLVYVMDAMHAMYYRMKGYTDTFNVCMVYVCMYVFMYVCMYVCTVYAQSQLQSPQAPNFEAHNLNWTGRLVWSLESKTQA